MPWSWDPPKSEANLRKHGVSFGTAELVFDDPLSLSLPDPYPAEERWRTIGVVGNRYLTFVHTDLEDEGQELTGMGRIISARKSTRTERKAYDERPR
ncbi:MAG: BrnT family toxin [Chloroflexi bacterium]|nr:BrnT family toxin [Chloroflexota bacterium]